MKTAKNILIAFVLNLAFSVFEFVGGLAIGSIAVMSDALHDLGDAMSIGVAFFLEKKSGRPADDTHTMGYGRYSVLGGLITTVILLIGSVWVTASAVHRILHPADIHYSGMILFAVIGAAVNLVAATVTREGDSLNQKAVNLHMLEDVLGWCVVLVGAIVMHFTDWAVLDPLMSIAVALFILIHALGNLAQVLDLFLGKTPQGISVKALKNHLGQLDGVLDVGRLQLWSMDGNACSAAVQIKARGDSRQIREQVRQELREHGITAATVELLSEEEPYPETAPVPVMSHHHHHH